MIISKKILVGVCGGIAAYKTVELVRLLCKQGAEVRVVMTASAQRFITDLTFQAISGNPVAIDLLDSEQERAMGHIQLARWADQILIAPATADFMGRLAGGLADDLLTTLCLAAECPVMLAPAMNQAMWKKPVVQDNITRLKRYGYEFIGPACGDLACGESGPGRMTEVTEIVDTLLKNPQDQPLLNIKILITAGPTRESIDPVRYITNRSSGKMGYAIAEAAVAMGAQVTLVSGPVHLKAPEGVHLISVESAEQMYQAVIPAASDYQVYIGAAAVADYTVDQVQTAKIKKQSDTLTLTLCKTRDILSEVASLKSRPDWVVGFAAETDALEAYALKKLRDKNLDMIAANWVGREQGGFDSEDNALQVFWQGGQRDLPMTDKKNLAKQLLALIAEKLHEKNTIKNTG